MAINNGSRIFPYILSGRRIDSPVWRSEYARPMVPNLSEFVAALANLMNLEIFHDGASLFVTQKQTSADWQPLRIQRYPLSLGSLQAMTDENWRALLVEIHSDMIPPVATPEPAGSDPLP